MNSFLYIRFYLYAFMLEAFPGYGLIADSMHMVKDSESLSEYCWQWTSLEDNVAENFIWDISESKF